MPVIGEPTVLTFTFFPKSGSGPSAVSVKFKKPDAASLTVVATTPSLNVWEALVTPDLAGVWEGRVEGDAGAKGVKEFRWPIEPSRVL